MEQSKRELDNFFDPISVDMEIAIERAKVDLFDNLKLKEFNLYFIPYLEHSSRISSILLADINGDEKMLLKHDTNWIGRQTFQRSGIAHHYEWSYENGQLDTVRFWEEHDNYSALNRPWFRGAIENKGKFYWTEPYTFYTTKDPGITVSRQWINGENEVSVIAFDLMLSDISLFTSNLDISKNGKVFILTEDDRLLGLPKDSLFSNRDSLKSNALKSLDEIDIPVLKVAKHSWIKTYNTKTSFPFEYEGEPWWGIINDYNLGNSNFLVAVIAPESDFIFKIEQSLIMVVGGFILILFFTIIISFAHRKIKKSNLQLNQQKIEIEKQRDYSNNQHQIAEVQKKVVEFKNTQILDSIQYAKRIQDAMILPEHIFKKHLPESFILYLPKDIVSGDFYWVNTKGNDIYFAAADCTGHGVPGALISMVCTIALDKSINEVKISEPAMILNHARELIEKTFDKSEHDVNDGMDIAFCKLNIKSRKLTFSGANNSLFRITKVNGENHENTLTHENKMLIEYKGDKQPVGRFDFKKPFTQIEVQLLEGDHIYLFTDGFPDQFGGENKRKFMYKPFKKLFLSLCKKSIEEQKVGLHKAFEEWKGSENQIDDVCIIGVQV